ncbi:MAG: hypothetical protein AAGD25_00500 [Cyanobacteria bacterium P01_F01_bin.150]
MADLSDETISLITYTPSGEGAEAPSKGILSDAISNTPRSGGTDASKGIGPVQVSAQTIQRELTRLMKSMGNALGQAKKDAGDLAGMELKEVELSVQISAEGKVSLMGIGGTQAGATGAITLKFGKPESKPERQP